MKRTLSWLLLFACFAVSFALRAEGLQVGEYVVTEAVEGRMVTHQMSKDLVKKAKVKALVKDLKDIDENMPEDLVRRACAEVDKFIEDEDLDVENKGEKTEPIDKNTVQLTRTYRVQFNQEAINQWLRDNGFKLQKVELTILEEPPTKGAMQIIDQIGTKFGDNMSFYKNYSSFQRRVRDCIIKKMDEFGFDVNLLSDNDLYEEFKKSDEVLVGTYFNPDSNSFQISEKMLNLLKSNNPDTVVLYYRLESLDYDGEKVKVTVGLSFKDLDSGVAKALSTADFSRPFSMQGKSLVALVDEVGFAAECAINKLMSAEGAKERVHRLVRQIKEEAKKPAGPIKVTINGNPVDEKIRKKFLYQIRKQLIDKGIVAVDETGKNIIKSNNTSLMFTADSKFKDPEELYFEEISPILEEMLTDDLVIPDDKVTYGKGSLVISIDAATND